MKLIPFIIALFLISGTNNPGIQEIIRRKLEAQKTDLTFGSEQIMAIKSVSKFYEDRVYQPVWEDSKMVDQLIDAISKAGIDGLNPEDYHYAALEKNRSKFNNLTDYESADFELVATDAFLLFTSHLLCGKVNPESIDPEWHVAKREGNPISVLENAVNSGNVRMAIEKSAPAHPLYLSLKQSLARYRKIQKQGGWDKIEDGETIKGGMEDKRLVSIRKRLIVTADLSLNSTAEIYDDMTMEAVIRFQKRNGLDPDGSIGKATISSMNVTVDQRIEQIELNMERWRWLPKDFSSYYIKVNIANFNLEVHKNGEKVREHKVIVGKNQRRTPVFNSTMTYIVLSPSWTIPPGILTKDVLPATRKSVDYLKTKNISVYNQQGVALDPNTVNWESSEVKAYTYRQPPGQNNALGAVKFMFPNSYSIYIHDTPSRELFQKEERSFSSGCVRVHQPLELAEYLINSPEWTLENIKKQVNSHTTITIPLNEKPEVYLLYWTSWMDEEGEIQFRKDIYERDQLLLKSLNAAAPNV